MDFRRQRRAVGLSQSRLAQLAAVSRFKLNAHELGYKPLSAAEQEKIESALRQEIHRLRGVLSSFGGDNRQHESVGRTA